MHTEYEVRVLEIDKDEIVRRLEQAGAEFQWDYVQRRYVYDFIPKVDSKWIRLRTNGKKTTLTIKNLVCSEIDGTQELEIEVDKLKTSLVGITVELPLSDWIFDETYNTYSQTITIEGVSEDSVPIIALKSAGEQATEEELSSYAYISDVITEDNSIKFIASEKPLVSLSVVAKSIWA
jgi:adenylate cyclase class 2